MKFQVSRGAIFFALWQYWTEKILWNRFSCFRTASLGGSGLIDLVDILRLVDCWNVRRGSIRFFSDGDVTFGSGFSTFVSIDAQVLKQANFSWVERWLKAVLRVSDTMRDSNRYLTHNSPKYLEWNLAFRKFEGFFPLNYAVLSFERCLNYSNSGFQRSDILKCWQYWTKKIL